MGGLEVRVWLDKARKKDLQWFQSLVKLKHVAIVPYKSFHTVLLTNCVPHRPIYPKPETPNLINPKS